MGPSKNEKSSDDDDLASFAVVQSKMQALFAVASDKIGDMPDDAPAAMAALLKLNSQLRSRSQGAIDRDAQYDAAGQVVKSPRTVLKDMDRAFELADAAYNELPNDQTLQEALADLGCTLIRHEEVKTPGYVAHYVALDTEHKVAVIGVKGTSSVEDMITDCCGQAVTHRLDAGPFVQGGPTEIRCHEGIILAAKRLANELETLVRDLILPSGYSVVMTGHSLGAGAAVLCGILLKSRIPALFRDKQGKLLKVLAFASPPVVDYDAALACQPFVTTFVNNSDIIPRASLSNVIITMEFVKAVSRKLDETGQSPKNFETTMAFLKMLADKDGFSSEESDMEEIRKEFSSVLENVNLRDPDHLYCPGRVVHMYDLWSKKKVETVEKGDEGGDEKEASDDADGNVVDSSSKDDSARDVERVYIGDGTSKVLRYIEMDSRMVSDDLSASYRKGIHELLAAPDDGEDNGLFGWISNIFSGV